jgi:hypothetical protein
MPFSIRSRAVGWSTGWTLPLWRSAATRSRRCRRPSISSRASASSRTQSSSADCHTVGAYQRLEKTIRDADRRGKREARSGTAAILLVVAFDSWRRSSSTGLRRSREGPANRAREMKCLGPPTPAVPVPVFPPRLAADRGDGPSSLIRRKRDAARPPAWRSAAWLGNTKKARDMPESAHASRHAICGTASRGVPAATQHSRAFFELIFVLMIS